MFVLLEQGEDIGLFVPGMLANSGPEPVERLRELNAARVHRFHLGYQLRDLQLRGNSRVSDSFSAGRHANNDGIEDHFLSYRMADQGVSEAGEELPAFVRVSGGECLQPPFGLLVLV
jgi:hypothetical protein